MLKIHGLLPLAKRHCMARCPPRSSVCPSSTSFISSRTCRRKKIKTRSVNGSEKPLMKYQTVLNLQGAKTKLEIGFGGASRCWVRFSSGKPGLHGYSRDMKVKWLFCTLLFLWQLFSSHNNSMSNKTRSPIYYIQPLKNEIQQIPNGMLMVPFLWSQIKDRSRCFLLSSSCKRGSSNTRAGHISAMNFACLGLERCMRCTWIRDVRKLSRVSVREKPWKNLFKTHLQFI